MSDWKARLIEAKELLELGIIDQAEFDALKSKALQNFGTPPPAPPKLLTQETHIGPSIIPEPDPLRAATHIVAENPLSVPTADNPLEGRTLMEYTEGMDLGHYRIMGTIGKGGMGIVYRARHKVEDFAAQRGDVAIKVMHDHLAQDPEYRRRFIAEAMVGIQFSHPNVVKSYDLILESERLGLVMDLVEGRPLDDMVPAKGMKWSQCISILRSLGTALDAIHAADIIHRDLKPENIIIAPDGSPKILDMGIAKISGNLEATRTGMRMGTPLYMAPEQGDAKRVSGAADRYALGLIAYYMLSGGLPWKAESGEYAIITQKYTGNLIPLSERSTELQPERLESASTVVMKMLRIQPQERFDSCQAFLDALCGASPQPIVSTPQPVDVRKPPPRPQTHPNPADQIERSEDVFWVGAGNLMRLIPAGEFVMGQDHGALDEQPAHQVTISAPYLIGVFPVTQAQWEETMEDNPSAFRHPYRPVEQITWIDAVHFCNALSQAQQLSPAYIVRGRKVFCNWFAEGFRLPTEAEWERAALGPDAPTTYAGGDTLNPLGWYKQNSGKKTQVVGQKAPNGFGLYDMSGNVMEWCWDWFSPKYYASGEGHDPKGVSKGSLRVARGGCWLFKEDYARIANRHSFSPSIRNSGVGLRIVKRYGEDDG